MALDSLMSFITGIDPKKARSKAMSGMKKACKQNVRQHRRLRKTMEEDPVAAIVGVLEDDGRDE